ncbi:MAG: tRNA epoxyqueuosine(34) reductase QueG [Candidatus Krumholzibacteriota bacterium]|nr:tRNA epoxyqueuosine(34) reductase QueG [Candidatus Krumholzibacteriota bacterium]
MTDVTPGARPADPEGLRAELLALGFDRVGFAPVGEQPDFARFRDWLAEGCAAGMDYLARHAEARRDPARLLAGARSVIMVSVSYHAPRPAGEGRGGDAAKSAGADDPATTDEPAPAGFGRVSRYARGRDYHRVLRGRLRQAARLLAERHGARAARICVDTAPLLERSLAARAGLGWIGRNTCLVDPELGSWTFLGALLTDLDLPPDSPQPDRCGDCRACLDACPTGALAAPGRLDARHCLSYLTIEHRGPLPAELAARLEGRVFGCDRCQEVCPFNAGARATRAEDFHPRPDQGLLELAPLLALDRAGLAARFAGTPLMRAGAEGLRRNAAAVLEGQRRRR